MTIDASAIESLRNFALSAGEMQFAHLCSSAINGEGWAVERLADSAGVANVLRLLRAAADAGTVLSDGPRDRAAEILRDIDTTRPDGLIARTMSEP